MPRLAALEGGPLARGFLPNGDKIVSTRTTTPREYEAAWERQRIADRLHAWARLQGERPLPPLPCALAARLEGLAPVLRRQVAKAEKMRRHRDGNPEGVPRFLAERLLVPDEMERLNAQEGVAYMRPSTRKPTFSFSSGPHAVPLGACIRAMASAGTTGALSEAVARLHAVLEEWIPPLEPYEKPCSPLPPATHEDAPGARQRGAGVPCRPPPLSSGAWRRPSPATTR